MDDPSADPATTPTADPGPPEDLAPVASPTPGERRLERPPSERYGPPPTSSGPGTTGDATDGAAPARGLVFAVLAAIALAAAITVLGGIVLISAGLVVVAATGGWVVAMGLRLGAGATIDRRRRRWLAVGLAIGGVLLGQVGLWLFARTEGGVLPIAEYLGETFGTLVPLQVLAGGLAAAWAAR